MSEGVDRGELRPDSFLGIVEKYLKECKQLDEVLIRRFISGLFFSVFNYWARKKYNGGERGCGNRQDNFPMKELYSDMLRRRLDGKLIELMYYRVAADHHVLNPTVVKLYISKDIAFGKKEVRFSKTVLFKAFNISRKLIEYVDQLSNS